MNGTQTDCLAFTHSTKFKKFIWMSALQWITSRLPPHISLHIYVQHTPFITLKTTGCVMHALISSRILMLDSEALDSFSTIVCVLACAFCFACLNCTCLHCYLFVNVSKKMCVWVCTHSVILVPILSDAHWEKQIHSEKQIVPLLWVWSSHKEKGQSQKTKEWESCQVQYILSFPLFHYLSIHSFKVYTWTVFSLLPLPPALICMPSLGEKKSLRLTVEMNFRIAEYTYNREFHSDLLRKDLLWESIYP